MKTLTIFTPTYNRAHLLRRVYESLVTQTCRDFEWLVVDDGSTDFTRRLVEEWQREGRIEIAYVYKPNGGLHTAYNTAYAMIETELSMCVDSDDFLPDDAVEIITDEWRRRGGEEYAGLLGLDFDYNTMEPIGGHFPEGMTECWFLDLYTRRIHRGDTKPVLRTALMREVSPQVGFEGEKHFNPVYSMLKVCDRKKLLVVDRCLCIVDYQTGADSMSEQIYAQYVGSPRSFAKLRALEMTLDRSPLVNSLRVAIHYNSSVAIARRRGLTDIPPSPRPLLTALTYLPGLLLARHILKRCPIR